MSEDARRWLAGRTPRPPEAFDRWSDVDRSEEDLVHLLAEAGLDELDRAARAPGRVRASAFHLLAADGFLTYACEAAADSEDVGHALDDVLSRLGDLECL